MNTGALIDQFQRQVTYLRLSVTDRCDFRCLYCMAEDMTFLPRKEVLTLEELARVARIFTELGVEKIRVTGGEPLIRKDIGHLFRALGQLPHLRSLCMTTNGSHLAEYAQELADAGLQRINISLDSLKPDRFSKLTRYGKLEKVLEGLDTALRVGFEKIKLNTVLMRHFNLDEAQNLARFALERGMDISFIEEMPLGEIQSHVRNVEHVSSKELRETLSRYLALSPVNDSTGGPSRYWKVNGYTARIGFISPHSENFCATCNRVRLSASGRLLLCLGNEHSVDLRDVMRANPHRDAPVIDAIFAAMHIKPERHFFDLETEPQILRFMNATGG